MSGELKGCPFCGSERVVINRPANGAAPYALCQSCGSAGAQVADAASDDAIAIAAWNTRPTCAEIARVGEMREAIIAGLKSFESDQPDFSMSRTMRENAADHILAQTGLWSGQSEQVRETVERCAKVAEMPGFEEARDTDFDVGYNHAKRKIATAIRKLGEKVDG